MMPQLIRSKISAGARLFYLCSLLSAALPSFPHDITGTVKELSGEPLIGANVIWAGTSYGTVTNESGHFMIEQQSRSAQLIISYVGFVSDTITVSPTDTVPLNVILRAEAMLGEVTAVGRRMGQVKSRGLMNETSITRTELTRAACCNLGESFTTNPSVDVSYADAATGAKQIKLLGLSGSYVQMLTENIPNYRGAASPYSLGYVPGPWMQSIQVSKGSSSVKNGYESITGQINVEFLKPQAEKVINANLFGDSMGKLEANADANFHINDHLSTGILLHYEDCFKNHDGNNDGFIDRPDVRQYNIQNRWAWFGDNYIFQAAIKALNERRESGQINHGHIPDDNGMEVFHIDLNTERYEVFAKNAYIFDQEHNTNLALILSGSLHKLDAGYGHKEYQVSQKNLYASLLFETDFTPMHNLSAGLSLMHDYYGQHYRMEYSHLSPLLYDKETETVPGAYAQYTFNWNDKLIVMGGIRADHSSIYGTFITPRAHIKYAPANWGSFRLSAGKGYRTVHALAENNYLLSSGRNLIVNAKAQESAWNYGASATFYIPTGRRNITLNVEYYYTHFLNQTIVDYDSQPGAILITDLQGRSYSHTFQIDATYQLFRGMTVTAAYRLNDVKTTYGGHIMDRPLSSRYKGLFTASYSTPMDIWQFDATLQLNGGGRMPTPATDTDGTTLWPDRFPAYPMLSAQVTRWFRHWSIYVGGENLTGYKQPNPIAGAQDPWSAQFDPTMIWGPVHGAMLYAGVRLKL